MRKRSILSAGASLLLIAVLAIMAFLRGPLQIWFLVSAFIVWGVWMLTAVLLSNRTAIQAKLNARQRQRQRTADRKRAAAQPQIFSVQEEAASSVDQVLLRHVNYRVSAYLKSAYPDVTWEWQDKSPERIIVKGGTARIRLFGAADFNFADVIFDQRANIDCDMMRIVPLAQLNGLAAETESTPPAASSQPVDPAVWYDLQGRQVLEALVADLHSRNHSSLTIKESGEICIRQGDSEVKQDQFKSFPPKVCWTGIVKVLEDAGLAATTEDCGIVVSW